MTVERFEGSSLMNIKTGQLYLAKPGTGCPFVQGKTLSVRFSQD